MCIYIYITWRDVKTRTRPPHWFSLRLRPGLGAVFVGFTTGPHFFWLQRSEKSVRGSALSVPDVPHSRISANKLRKYFTNKLFGSFSRWSLTPWEDSWGTPDPGPGRGARGRGCLLVKGLAASGFGLGPAPGPLGTPTPCRATGRGPTMIKKTLAIQRKL